MTRLLRESVASSSVSFDSTELADTEATLVELLGIDEVKLVELLGTGAR